MTSAVYVSGAMLRPPHGTNGHVGVLVADEPTTWRCRYCHAVVIGAVGWRALVAAGWCPDRLAALPLASAPAAEAPRRPPHASAAPLTIPERVAAVVRSVVPIWAAASTDVTAASSQGGGMADGYQWHALGPKVEISGRGWSRTWLRRTVRVVVERVCTDPDIASLLDEWRAMSAEVGALMRYAPQLGRSVATDPKRVRALERALDDVRRRAEALYGARAAAELLGVSAQLSLFEAAS